MLDVFHILSDLNIPYATHEHQAVFTVEDASCIDEWFDAAASKNLFLWNKKNGNYYLVVTKANKRVDLKKLQETLQESKLSFAKAEQLNAYLGITPGSVSPFGLINDANKIVHAIIDTDLMQAEKQAFHPNKNTATIVLTTEDFKKYLEWTQHKVQYIQIESL
jgi:Ala-tRNA(Pro) deacylase